MQSFSAPGYPYDNAVVESFFKFFKKEELNRRHFRDQEELKRSTCGMLEKGQSLAAHFRSQDWCPPMLTQMMAVGEQSSALDELLAKAAEHLERELEAKIMGLTTLIEPVMILVMGLVVAFLVAAVLLPVFEMNQLVH